jgi:diguanylate cyclase (GGDEF)-like protein
VGKRNISREEGIREIAGRILKPETEPLNTHYEGPHGRVLLTSRYIENIDWFLIVEQDEESALASTRVSLLRTVIIGIAASLLIILLSALTVNYYHRNLEALATTDSLTGCANRREMRSRLERMLYRKTRYGTRVSLIMIDIDRFKELNDTQGHQAGDQVLKDLTRIIGDGKRPDDLLARWGGDEFMVILEAGIDAGRILAERIRYFFAQDWSDRHPSDLRITLSMGIAELKENEEVDSLIQRADKALYEAKRSGRDRIRTAEKI